MAGDLNMNDLHKAAEAALRLLEEYAQAIEHEWGDCRSPEEVEKDGDMEVEILNLRAALAALNKENQS
jgi:hypothetical protein